MPMIRIDTVKDGKMRTKRYNTDTAELLCNTPKGKLFLRRGRNFEIFLYDQNQKKTRDKITVVTWDEAKELVRTYGTRDMFHKYFAVVDSDAVLHFFLKGRYAVKTRRNAMKKNMNATQFVKWLVDKYDKHRYSQRKRLPNKDMFDD